MAVPEAAGALKTYSETIKGATTAGGNGGGRECKDDTGEIREIERKS